MATYKNIQIYIKDTFHTSVKSCWISDMKEQCNIPLKKAHNWKDSNLRKYPCPNDKKIYIKKAFIHFKMING